MVFNHCHNHFAQMTVIPTTWTVTSAAQSIRRFVMPWLDIKRGVNRFENID